MAVDQALHAHGLFVGGKWIEAGKHPRRTITSPATGEPLAQVIEATADNVDAAVHAAKTALSEWSALSPGERSAALWKLADILEQHAGDLAELESRNCGKPLKLVNDGDIPFGIDNLRFFAAAARTISGGAPAGEYAGSTSYLRREPIGVVGSIAPWNYPFMMAIWKIGPALAAGNTVVLKPAEDTPLTTLALAQYWQEAELPAGVFNVVTGAEEAGHALAAHPDVAMVSITGSVETGVAVMKAAADRVARVHLELGGKAPVVVFDDADIEGAVRGAMIGGLVNSGQDCTAATRLYVQSSVYDKFVARLVELLKTVRVGDPSASTTDIGPLISVAHQQRVHGFVERARKGGATVLIGGELPTDPALAKGAYYPPTLVTEAKQDSEIVQNEVFGPVMVALPFSTEEAAIELANDVRYGLAASVWTSDVSRAVRCTKALRFGTVWVNDHLPLASEMPHGGFKQSGFGKDLSMTAVEEYTVLKHVMFDAGSPAERDWHYTVVGDAAE